MTTVAEEKIRILNRARNCAMDAYLQFMNKMDDLEIKDKARDRVKKFKLQVKQFVQRFKNEIDVEQYIIDFKNDAKQCIADLRKQSRQEHLRDLAFCYFDLSSAQCIADFDNKIRLRYKVYD